jgi:hypothetical protein
MGEREEIKIEITTSGLTNADKRRGCAELEKIAKERGKKLNGGWGYNRLERAGENGEETYEFYGFLV